MNSERPSTAKALSTALLVVATLGWAAPIHAGALDGAVRKEIVKRALVRDLARDTATKAVPLAAERSVFRYTSAAQARRELRVGIKPGSHMTAKVTAGRPPLASTAQRQYGLPTPPAARLTIRLTRGTQVKRNKTLAGKPGRGELTSPIRLPAAAITKVTPLK